MTTSRLCGAAIYRCGECSNAVAGSRVKRGDGCPRHPHAETVNGNCGRRLAVGALRCHIHSGATPAVAAKAAERAVEADVSSALLKHGWQPVNNPLRALSDLLGEVVAIKDSFRDRVDELRSLTIEDQLGREDVRALLSAYERAVDRSGKLLVDASRLNLDERIVNIEAGIAQAQVDQLFKAMNRVLTLAPAPLASVMKLALAEQLRAIGKDGPPPPLPDAPKYVPAPVYVPAPTPARMPSPVPVRPSERLGLPAAPPAPPKAPEPSEPSVSVDVDPFDTPPDEEEPPDDETHHGRNFIVPPRDSDAPTTDHVVEARWHPGQTNRSQSYSAHLR